MPSPLSRARLLSCGAASLFAALAGAEARIESFSPTGFIKDVRQVAVRFSEPMVTLGDPDRSDPFAVRCAVPGTGRWIDERNWVYDFAHEVPGAERCWFTLRRGVTTLAGDRVAEPREHGFHTGGPTILDDLAHIGWQEEIDERQVILLALDAADDEDSIRAHAHCRVKGESRTIAVNVVSGAARSEILEALAAHHAGDLDELVESATNHLSKDDPPTLRQRALERIAMVQCAEPLPGRAEVELVWGAGVAGTNDAANRRDQVLSYTVRLPFAVTIGCSAKLQDKCLGSVSVGFTAYVDRKFAKHVRLVDSDGVEVPAIFRDDQQIQWVGFEGPLAKESSYTVELAGPIEDIDGRPVANRDAFPLVIRTGTPPPGATFGDGTSLVPTNDAAAMPVLLHYPQNSLRGRRILVADEPDIARWTLDFEDRERQRSSWGGYESALLGDAVPGTASFELPIEKPDAGFQVSGVPVAGAGLHVLELTLPPSRGLVDTRYVAGRAVKTRLAVHFQRGRESSLIWVTGIDDARPVADAVVRITDGCSGKSVWQGRTDTHGLAQLATTLPRVEECNRPFYLVSARKDGDLAFVAAGARGRISWGPSTPLRTHTILDRSLFQPGETVSMKHVFRVATSDGFSLPDPAMRTAQLTIRPNRGEVHTETIDIDESGTATSTFQLPDDARLGRYRIGFQVGDDHRSESGHFRVERFRVGSLRANVDTPTQPIVAPKSVPLDLEVLHLAGGGAAGLDVVVRATVNQHYDDDWADPAPTQPETRVVRATLDDQGRARVEIPDLPRLPDGGAMVAEMDYRDDNGQIRTASNRFDLWPAAIRLEIEPGKSEWPSLPPARISAYDVNGSPVPGIAIEAEFDTVATYATVRQRLPGGFRTSTTRTTWKTQGGCSSVTDVAGSVSCPMPSHLEEALVRATARDELGNLARASRWIRPTPDPFLDLVGDGPIEPGDTVPVRVTVPLEDATALVSVQREGVLDAFVTRVQGPQSVVDIPVKPNYAPNVDVSVLVVAPPESTTAGPIPGELEVTGDRARLRMESVLPRKGHGTISIDVGRTANTLAVDVVPDRDAYRVRDRARVRVAVTDPDGHPRRDAELALYAVDEGLLDLWPNPSADLLDAMMARRLNEVSSSSSLDAMTRSLYLSVAGETQTFVSGSHVRYWPARYYLPEAALSISKSDGPTAIVLRRQRFDRLLLWRARISTNDDGAAEVEVPLNDLVTSFRIVAVAVADAHLFGTGEATIRTTQDLVVNDALPPTVREGDRFQASFVVRNSSDTRQRVRVVAQADGLPELRPRTIRLPPGTSQEVSWRVTVPDGIDRLDWDVTARSGDASDGLVANQTVIAPIPVRVQQATITQVEGAVELPVAPPAEALPNRGGIGVSLRRSIAGGLDEMREYMSRYPYTCLEQQVSAAVALGDPERWSDLMADLERWMDDNGLLKYFPSDHLRGSPVLTAYLLTIADANGWIVPEHHREQLIDGIRGSGPIGNRTRRQGGVPIESGKLTGLSVLAALVRHQDVTYSPMIPHLDYNLDLLPTSALLDWIDVLHRVAPDHDDLVTAKGILRARLNLQGTSLGFSTEDRDRLWWLMVSTDGNAARAVLSLIDDPDWRRDLPRMMRGLLGRQQRGRWQTTVANAWGAVATARFAEVFEAAPVSGTSVARLGDEEHRAAWRVDEPPAPIDIPWSAGQVLTLQHEGAGAPWSLVELRAAVPLREAVARGYRIERTVEAADGRARRTWTRGDVAKVVLTVDADRDMAWVVVEDPLPPGAVVLGSGLGGDSSMLAGGYERGDAWPVFTERGFDSYRAYYQYVPKGRFTLRYSARYNTAGRFQLPPSRVEAMYAPEMHAEQPVRPITIR